jgi:hypothetical protein
MISLSEAHPEQRQQEPAQMGFAQGPSRGYAAVADMMNRAPV